MIKGKPVRLPSEKYRQWNKTASIELKNAFLGRETIKEVQSIKMRFFPKEKRLYDLSNKTESVMDTLVDAGILQDDNYKVVPRLILEHGEQDKENPRCEIEIHLL